RRWAATGGPRRRHATAVHPAVLPAVRPGLPRVPVGGPRPGGGPARGRRPPAVAGSAPGDLSAPDSARGGHARPVPDGAGGRGRRRAGPRYPIAGALPRRVRRRRVDPAV